MDAVCITLKQTYIYLLQNKVGLIEFKTMDFQLLFWLGFVGV